MLTIPYFLEHPDAESFTTITTCTSRIMLPIGSNGIVHNNQP